MPMQQVLLFRAMLLTYFSNPKELWPIMLNIDSVYQASSNERTAESRTSKSTGRVAEVLKSLSQTPKEGLLRTAQSAASGAGPIILKIFQQIQGIGQQGKQVAGIELEKITQRVL